jgi:hypothetical protein
MSNINKSFRDFRKKLDEQVYDTNAEYIGVEEQNEAAGINEQSVFIKHSLNIARKTVKMNDVMARIMGGMNKKEAHEFLLKHGTPQEKKNASKYLEVAEVKEGVEVDINELESKTNVKLSAGTKVKVPHKGKMVSGKIVRYDRGGTGQARQHGGGYIVDVGEPASILVPDHKILKEEIDHIEEGVNTVDINEQNITKVSENEKSTKTLYKYKNKYYLVSYLQTSNKTVIFSSKSDGSPSSYSELWSSTGKVDANEAISDFLKQKVKIGSIERRWVGESRQRGLSAAMDNAREVARRMVKMSDAKLKSMGGMDDPAMVAYGMTKPNAYKFLLKYGTDEEKSAAKKWLKSNSQSVNEDIFHEVRVLDGAEKLIRNDPSGLGVDMISTFRNIKKRFETSPKGSVLVLQKEIDPESINLNVYTPEQFNSLVRGFAKKPETKIGSKGSWSGGEITVLAVNEDIFQEATLSKYLKTYSRGKVGDRKSEDDSELARKKREAAVLRRGGASPESIKQGVKWGEWPERGAAIAKYNFYDKAKFSKLIGKKSERRDKEVAEAFPSRKPDQVHYVLVVDNKVVGKGSKGGMRNLSKKYGGLQPPKKADAEHAKGKVFIGYSPKQIGDTYFKEGVSLTKVKEGAALFSSSELRNAIEGSNQEIKKLKQRLKSANEKDAKRIQKDISDLESNIEHAKEMLKDIS